MNIVSISIFDKLNNSLLERKTFQEFSSDSKKKRREEKTFSWSIMLSDVVTLKPKNKKNK
jgi:hypothetical protein